MIQLLSMITRNRCCCTGYSFVDDKVSLYVTMFCVQLRVKLWRQLRANWEGSNHSWAAIAGSITASLATLVFCFVRGSIFCSNACSWNALGLHKVPIGRGVTPLATPTSLATHEPYSTEPPSFLSSPGYQGICNSTAAQQQGCNAEVITATSYEQAPPCTPDSMRY